MEATPVPPPDPVAELVAAHREYSASVSRFLADERAMRWLKEMLANFSLAALTVAATAELQFKIDLLPELVLNLCQGRPAEVVLARNAIRSLPKSEVERRVAFQMPEIFERMNADELSQLADLLVELGLATAVEGLARYAAVQPDPEMLRLAEELDGVQHDDSRWRLRPSERRHQ